MQFTKPLRALLLISGLIAVWIGASILLSPVDFHAANGIELASDPSLMSEVRAPGGALLALGVVILLGAFSRAHVTLSTVTAAVVYLAYGVSRIASFGFDGMPDPGLVQATVFELVIGAACLFALLRGSAVRASVAS